MRNNYKNLRLHFYIAVIMISSMLFFLLINFFEIEISQTIQFAIMLLMLISLIIGVSFITWKDRLIKEEINMLSMFMENTPDVVYFKDINSKFIRVSKAFNDKTFNLKREQLVGKTDFDLFDTKHAQKAFNDEQEIIRTKEPKLRLLEKEIHKDGEIHWVITSKLPLLNEDGDVIGTFGISRDITDEKKALENLEKARKKEQERIQELERRTNDSVLLNEMNDNLQITPILKEGFYTIADFASKIFQDEIGALYVIDEDSQLNLLSSWGKISDVTEKSFDIDQCWGMSLGFLHVYARDNLENKSPLCEHIHSKYSKMNMCIPIIAPGETFGMLFLQPKDQTNQNWITEYKLQFIKNFAISAGLSLANINLRVDLREQSIRDPLTSLFNRRFLEETMIREISRAKRNKSTIGVIMLDIDHFKLINDQYGHEVGDYVLKKVSEILNKMIRAEDIACRYGGEEFTLILHETKEDVLFYRAEKIRKEIEQMQLYYNGQKIKPITISAGMYIYSDYEMDMDQIIEKADQALYEAKENGRNQTCIAK